jgi:hypothetical protein
MKKAATDCRPGSKARDFTALVSGLEFTKFTKSNQHAPPVKGRKLREARIIVRRGVRRNIIFRMRYSFF